MGLKFVVQKAKVKEDFQNFKNIEHAAKAMAILKSNTFKKFTIFYCEKEEITLENKKNC